MYIVLTVILDPKGVWWGVFAAAVRVLSAITLEWALLPLAHGWATFTNTAGAGSVARFTRPYYKARVVYDVIGMTMLAAFAQGLRIMATSDPRAGNEE